MPGPGRPLARGRAQATAPIPLTVWTGLTNVR